MNSDEKGSSLWLDAWLRLRRNRAAMVGLFLLILIGSSCILLPALTDFLKDPNKTDLVHRNLKPGAEHWFGTDHLGRDLFSRVIFGGRISIAVGLITTFVSVTIGIVWGAIAGYVGGRTDAFLMRVVDILYALPFLVVIILLGKILEPLTDQLTESTVHLVAGENADTKQLVSTRNWVEPLTTLVPVFIAIGALSWLTVSRIVRAQVQSVASLDFVEAARSLGLGHFRILFRHILPNTLGPIIVYTTLTIPGVMMFEATLSFLGLGVKAPNSSWGVLIQEGANFMLTNPLQLLFPALFFSLTLFSLNFLGDGLRDATDPKAAKD
ncbi:MAG: ABC transporter permease [Verrucomicrobia bacterium]|nr:MAG: ABC transporter permease [Verrucomicrobiota bacterium]TAE86114.1 MAG: ABC transporter permease [Verrucomicrobiota bacterium]TAF23461.1 MAG: ABC transporter permease [Verrucomicrobiota bacterium]TAF40091.1 MAG: ABC transporter permease [Verrucomicrobiota bacterium]